jgi:hypothetical protein
MTVFYGELVSVAVVAHESDMGVYLEYLFDRTLERAVSIR